MTTRSVYVVWMNVDNSINGETFEISGNINHETIREALYETWVESNHNSYYDFSHILSWNIEEY